MADDILTKDEMALLDQLAALIRERPPEEREGALVASYDYLVAQVDDPAFTRRDRMVLLSLFPLEKNVDDSSEVQKAADVEAEESPLDERAQKALEQVAGLMAVPIDSLMLLNVVRGSTKWYKTTSTGVICFRKRD